MILYSWKKVYKISGGKASKIIDIIQYITNRPVPENKQDPNFDYAKVNWNGSSFLLDPYSVLRFRTYYTEKELAEYVGLASYRNYAEYKVNNIITLDLLYSPIKQDKLKKNRLLRIQEDRIHFCWEEVTNWRKKW